MSVAPDAVSERAAIGPDAGIEGSAVVGGLAVFGERLSARQWGGVGACLLGLVLIATP